MSEAIYTKGDYLENNPTWHLEDSTWKAEQILNIFKKIIFNPYQFVKLDVALVKFLISST